MEDREKAILHKRLSLSTSVLVKIKEKKEHLKKSAIPKGKPFDFTPLDLLDKLGTGRAYGLKTLWAGSIPLRVREKTENCALTMHSVYHIIKMILNASKEANYEHGQNEHHYSFRTS